MSPIAVLVLYASRHGQTRKIVQRVSARLSAGTLDVELREIGAGSPSRTLDGYDAIVIGAPVRYETHSAELRRFVVTHRRELASVPSVLVSVSLSAGLRSKHRKNAQNYIRKFLSRTGWQPVRVAAVAGALRYTSYGWLTRLAMRFMAFIGGADTDASRDHEYTDWVALDSFADELAGEFATLKSAPTGGGAFEGTRRAGSAL